MLPVYCQYSIIAGGTPGALYTSGMPQPSIVAAATTFGITSTSGSDTSTVHWELQGYQG